MSDSPKVPLTQMQKDAFTSLTVKEIKAIFDEGNFPFDMLLWAQEDRRSSVQKLAASYVMKQKERWKRNNVWMRCMYMRIAFMRRTVTTLPV